MAGDGGWLDDLVEQDLVRYLHRSYIAVPDRGCTNSSGYHSEIQIFQKDGGGEEAYPGVSL